ncbi:MAG TPA: hypothetical protein VHB97_14020, partial [Polyangia bacterium]|nr:hypothetical protein [Polyangia bacterium]
MSLPPAYAVAPRLAAPPLDELLLLDALLLDALLGDALLLDALLGDAPLLDALLGDAPLLDAPVDDELLLDELLLDAPPPDTASIGGTTPFFCSSAAALRSSPLASLSACMRSVPAGASATAPDFGAPSPPAFALSS